MQKKTFFLLLKISLSVALILWITEDIALDSVFTVMATSSTSLLIFAFSLFFCRIRDYRVSLANINSSAGR
jgi:uncharacterized membrane protein